MAVSFSVRADVKRAMSALNDAQRKVVPAAVSAALNRAVKQAHTASVKEAAREFRVPQKVLRWNLRFQRRDRASRRNWEAGVFVVSKNIRAKLAGKPRQQRKGARAGRHLFHGAFVATMKSGYTGIFRRRGRDKLPIDEVEIPIRDKVEPIVRNNIETVGLPAFRKRFAHELNYRLRKRGL